MNKDNFDFENEIPETPKTKFSDLDLGLDFDLSFLDDLDESVLDEAPAVETPPVKKPAPAKKPAAKKAVSGKTAEEAPARKPATPKKATPAQAEPGAAPKKKAAAPKKPVPAPEAPAPKKQKKGPRVGSVIFYTIYFLFILAFFGALYLGLNWLHGWLSDFEAAQPTLKAEQVFQEVFTDPDWGALYESAGAKDSPYEGKEQYVNYMEEKVGDSKLTYMETSAGLDSTKKKFIVKLGDEKVATFTLIDRNNVGNMDLSNLANMENIDDIKEMADIPDWQLGAVEVFFERVGTYYIVKMGDHTASVNGVELDDSFTIQMATTVAEKYLPEGTNGFVTCIQQVDGLMEVPTVVITDKNGEPVEVTYDEAARIFTAKTENNTVSDELDTIALEAAKAYSQWMIDELHDRAVIAKYFDASTEAYNRIVKSTELWMQNHAGYRFENDSVTDYARYSDDIASVKVKTDLIVTRLDGSEKTWEFNQSMFFRKNEAGKWLCFESTNVDVSEPVGKVRLTFMQGDTQLTTDFYETDAKEIITPKLPVPEGQVFSGWVTVSKNENGDTVYNVEFQPSEDGTVKLPEGNTLKPMTLYALFQDASEVAAEAAAAPETIAPETTPVETAATETAATETAVTETVVPETTEGA